MPGHYRGPSGSNVRPGLSRHRRSPACQVLKLTRRSRLLPIHSLQADASRSAGRSIPLGRWMPLPFIIHSKRSGSATDSCPRSTGDGLQRARRTTEAAGSGGGSGRGGGSRHSRLLPSVPIEHQAHWASGQWIIQISHHAPPLPHAQRVSRYST